MKQNEVMGIMRAVLAALGGILGGAGYANNSDWAQVSGAIMVLVTAIWSVIEKRKIELPPASGMMLVLILMGGLLTCGGCATTRPMMLPWQRLPLTPHRTIISNRTMPPIWSSREAM